LIILHNVTLNLIYDHQNSIHNISHEISAVIRRLWTAVGYTMQ